MTTSQRLEGMWVKPNADFECDFSFRIQREFEQRKYQEKFISLSLFPFRWQEYLKLLYNKEEFCSHNRSPFCLFNGIGDAKRNR